jgi:hypothetical protein
MDANELIGKTIVDAKFEKDKGFDDEPYLVLSFSDGTVYTVCASFGTYTGESKDEYPSFISIYPGLPKNDEEE